VKTLKFIPVYDLGFLLSSLFLICVRLTIFLGLRKTEVCMYTDMYIIIYYYSYVSVANLGHG